MLVLNDNQLSAWTTKNHGFLTCRGLIPVDESPMSVILPLPDSVVAKVLGTSTDVTTEDVRAGDSFTEAVPVAAVDVACSTDEDEDGIAVDVPPDGLPEDAELDAVASAADALNRPASAFSSENDKAKSYVVGTLSWSSFNHGIWYPPIPILTVFAVEASRNPNGMMPKDASTPCVSSTPSISGDTVVSPG